MWQKDEIENVYKLKGLMCDQNNLNDQSVINLKLKGLMWGQSNLKSICYKPQT